MNSEKPHLIRGLTLRDTISLVVGTIIGTGVFLKTSNMAQAVGSPKLVLLAWVAAGILSLAGALTYAELGAMLPKAGGEYVFLRTAYGDLPAFLFGWMRLVVGSSGSIAIFGVAFATFLSALIPLDMVWAEKTFYLFKQKIDWQFGIQQIVAVGIILIFSAINCLRVVFGGRIQTILTLAKVVGIGAIIVGVFFFAPTASWEHLKAPLAAKAWCGWSAFGAAMLAALWAFDGWNNMPMVAGEVQNPERNIPRALIVGMLIVLLIYGLANLAYCYALPFQEILTSHSTLYRSALPVASKAAQTFLGTRGPALVSIAFLISTLGVLNGSILTSARIPYAMARDGLFFSRFATLSKETAVPVAAIILQAIWSSLLAISATFDQLTNYVVFAGWIFYAATTAAVFVLRKKMPNVPRPYKTLGYPVVPLIFVLVAGWLLINTLQTNPMESGLGLALIALGLPVYGYVKI
ncbi:MAG: amino acid permease, partial [Verrucomicrobiota bacterium]|nr:amino acid permease [Verrucomicrobiota bacterium]